MVLPYFHKGGYVVFKWPCPLANFDSSFFPLKSPLITIRPQLITSTSDKSIKIYIRFVHRTNVYLQSNFCKFSPLHHIKCGPLTSGIMFDANCNVVHVLPPDKNTSFLNAKISSIDTLIKQFIADISRPVVYGRSLTVQRHRQNGNYFLSHCQ